MLSSTTSRLAAFAVALAFAAGAAAAVGAATDATPPFQDCLKVAAAEAGSGDDAMAGAPHGAEPMIEAVPGSDGRRSELAGLSLQPLDHAFRAGSTSTWRFRIIDCDGHALRDFEPEQTKLLHLIVARTDFTGYQHLHPTLAKDGTWSVTVTTPRSGRYRAIADFVTGGRKYVLGTTLVVPGASPDVPMPPPRLHATSDGYDVELQRPALVDTDADAQLTFRVSRRGRPVTDLEPYLGSYGHLVALHAPELSYSHVHPVGEDRAAGAITFDTEFHEAGRFRLFLQFQTRGRVHTV
ncbi:MAG: hypothetical protein QOF76_2970, partial [Solirubrobacteraceae bacterium]|nr:hypothetical protein [Solirubrobacteraceae bacterium]